MLTIEREPHRADVRVSEVGSDLLLLTWLGRGAARRSASRSRRIARSRGAPRARLRPRPGARVRRSLRRPGGARDASAPSAAPARAGRCPRRSSRARQLERRGVSGIHVIGARGRARTVSEGERVFGTLVETRRRARARPLGRRPPGRRPARRRARPRRRGRRSTPPSSCSRARGSRSATWRAPGSTCATSSTGTAPSTRCATPPSSAWACGRGRRRADPGQHGDRGPQRAGGLVRARPPRDRAAPGRPAGDRRLHNGKQNEATEYGSAFARAIEVVGRRRPLHLRLGDGLDRRSRRVGAPGGLRDADALHAGGRRGAAPGRGAPLSRRATGHRLPQEPGDGRAFERIVERAGLAEAAARHDGRRRVPRRAAVRDRRDRRPARPRGIGGEAATRSPSSAWPRRRAPSLLGGGRRRGRRRRRPPRRSWWRRCPRGARRRGARRGHPARGPSARGAGSSSSRRGAGARADAPASRAPPTPRSPSTARGSCSPGRRRPGDPWCVFEMKADGSGARQVTCGAAGARQPVYQPTVYTITPTNVEPWIQVAFVGENPGESNEAGVAPNTSLWS